MLSLVEAKVRRIIQESDAPFLGLLGASFTPEMRQAIRVAVSANPTAAGYDRYLEMHPALFAINLASHVMDGMGQAGHFELYSHVCKAIGATAGLTSQERERLWKAFRKAILTLGLEPSPRTYGTHYMADEYLRQAGVPLAFADDLASRMLSFARKVGLPDRDDPEGIASWQAALDAKLDAPFSATARKAVNRDSPGYYTRVFLRVSDAGGQPVDPSNMLEQAMARAFQSLPATASFRRAALPFVMLHDGNLGVFFPGGDEREFEVVVDGNSHIHRSGIEDRFVPLAAQFPKEVVVRDTVGGQSSRFGLWEDDKSNRLLLFSETGRLRARGQLAQEESLVLAPGTYTVLSRFAPIDIDTDELWEEPQLYAFPVTLHPEKQFLLRNGPAQLVLQGEGQPFVQWQGESRTTKEGVEFHHGQLQLVVEMPSDWLSITGRDYVLRIVPSGLGTELELPISLDDTGRATVDLTSNAGVQAWPNGFTRLLAEVRRPGEARTLLRSAVFFWHGLRSVSSGLSFECAAVPSNFELKLSENVQVVEDALKPKDSSSKIVRLVFDLGGRRQSLTWNVPGVFVEVETYGEGGAPKRLSRPLRSTEAVSSLSSKQVVISATEPGTLKLGSWSQHVDFSRKPSKALPAGFLAGRITPESNWLVYCSDRNGLEIELLKLLQPHHVQKLSARVQSGQFVICLDMPKELQALAVRAGEVITGEDFEATLEANASEWTQHRFGRARLMVLKNGSENLSAHIYFDLELLPPGGWVFHLSGKVDGIWGHLENERQDLFDAGMLWGEEGSELQSRQFLLRLKDLTDKQSLEVLERVHESMLPCYALDAWGGLQWLDAAWDSLLARWVGRESEAIAALIDLSIATPPEDSSPSWMLQRTVGSALSKVFALPASDYRKVNDRHRPVALALKAIAGIGARYPSIFQDLVHEAAAAAFSNLHAVARGAPPQGFSLPQYVEALKGLGTFADAYRFEDNSFLPGPGDYLGPLHYKQAFRALETAYERALGGNDQHRGEAMRLCRDVRRLMPKLGPDAPKGIRGQPPHVVPWLYLDDEGVPPEVAQRRENLANIAHLLSWLAYACRSEARDAGALNSFLEKLKATGVPLEHCMAYLLQLGDALFAFYLLLWELVATAEQIHGGANEGRQSNRIG